MEVKDICCVKIIPRRKQLQKQRNQKNQCLWRTSYMGTSPRTQQRKSVLRKQAESALQIDMNVKSEHMKIYATLLITKKCKLKLQRNINMHLSRVTSITHVIKLNQSTYPFWNVKRAQTSWKHFSFIFFSFLSYHETLHISGASCDASVIGHNYMSIHRKHFQLPKHLFVLCCENNKNLLI